MAPWVAMSAAVGYLGGHALGDLLTGTHHPAPGFLRNMQTLLPALAPAFAVSIGFTYFFYARGRLAASEAQAQAARRTAAENQLKLLVSQLEPHMLFNTLANLRVLIGQDPPRAQAMLDHLNGFLRATLDASRSDSHALSAEFARIADYLELMQVRMGPRLRGTLDLPADLSSLPVPPLLLQPLVENAVKHGLEPSVSGGQIEVSARRDGHGLCLSVRDTGVGLGAAAHGSRFGMQQVRERLVALYGDAASLELTTPADGRGGALAVVRLPVA
jgi:LytS/YehU family sensor histidine kinase